MKKHKKILGMKKDSFFALLAWAGIILIAYFLIQGSSGAGSSSEGCPDRIQGNVNASLKIKYFESPYCVYCWLEEPILESMLETRGHLFRLERYDVRYCHNETRKYGVSGTPSFVFGMKGDSKEYTHYGFIKKEDLERVICGATGGC